MSFLLLHATAHLKFHFHNLQHKAARAGPVDSQKRAQPTRMAKESHVRSRWSRQMCMSPTDCGAANPKRHFFYGKNRQSISRFGTHWLCMSIYSLPSKIAGVGERRARGGG